MLESSMQNELQKSKSCVHVETKNKIKKQQIKFITMHNWVEVGTTLAIHLTWDVQTLLVPSK